MRIEGLPGDRLAECVEGYRAILIANGARIVGERRSATKNRVEFVLRLPRAGAREELQRALCDAPVDIRGDVDWEVE